MQRNYHPSLNFAQMKISSTESSNWFLFNKTTIHQETEVEEMRKILYREQVVQSIVA